MLGRPHRVPLGCISGFQILEWSAAFCLWEHRPPRGRRGLGRAVNHWEGRASRAGGARGPDLSKWAFKGQARGPV